MQMFVADKHEYPLAAIDYPDHYTGWENILSRAELDGEPTHATKPNHNPPPGIWHCPAVTSMHENFPWVPGLWIQRLRYEHPNRHKFTRTGRASRLDQL